MIVAPRGKPRWEAGSRGVGPLMGRSEAPRWALWGFLGSRCIYWRSRMHAENSLMHNPGQIMNSHVEKVICSGSALKAWRRVGTTRSAVKLTGLLQWLFTRLQVLIGCILLGALVRPFTSCLIEWFLLRRNECCSFNQWELADQRHSYPKGLEAWQGLAWPCKILTSLLDSFFL